MKTLLMTAVILLSAVAVSAQTSQKVSLELGIVTVYLGEPKAEVVSACADVGFKAVETYNGLAVSGGGTAYPVHIKNGRVTQAFRSWSKGRDEVDALLGALATLDGKECIVSHKSVDTPDMQVNQARVVCGPRFVVLSRGNMAGKASTDVFEGIGDVDDK
jgi:hypothetical protein